MFFGMKGIIFELKYFPTLKSKRYISGSLKLLNYTAENSKDTPLQDI